VFEMKIIKHAVQFGRDDGQKMERFTIGLVKMEN
jgi:hypothetical protein